MDYIEYNFSIEPLQPWTEILVARLSGLGFDMFEDHHTGTKAYISKENHTFSTESEIKEVMEGIDCKIAYEKLHIKAENWNAVWESNFEPVVVDNACCVRASFHEPRPDLAYDLVIDPKMSFGTGHHQTTALVISQMLNMQLSNTTVLDIGCGTAVLAILAARMGAKAVTAIDIDEWAYANSLENIEKNATPDVKVLQGGAEILDNTSYDVIFANINKNIILRDITRYEQVLAPGGTLVLSGFLDTDIHDISQAAQVLGLKRAASATNNQWAVLSLVK